MLVHTFCTLVRARDAVHSGVSDKVIRGRIFLLFSLVGAKNAGLGVEALHGERSLSES